MRRLCLSSGLILACSLAALQAATLERLSLDDLAAKSTAVVRGKVTGSYAAFRGPVIYTHYSVQVTETLKGASQGRVDVVVPGGIASDLRQVFSGAPQLAAGEDLVLFLWTGPSGLTQIMGLTQGLFRLSTATASSIVTATRAASSELMLDAKTGRPVKDETLVMTLSELRARVAGSLQKVASK